MPSRELSRRRLVGGAMGVALLVVALGLTAALGGFAATTDDGVATVEPGTPVHVQPFTVTLDSAAATYTQGGLDADPQRAYVSVDGTLTLAPGVDTAVGVGTLDGAFVSDLEDVYSVFGEKVAEGEDADASVSVRPDGSGLAGLGPGLTYDVRLTWTVEEASVPSDLTVTLNRHTWRPSSLDDTFGWFDPAPAARVHLDVAPLPDERPDPEEF